jgi:ribonuclease P protein component
MAKGKIAHSPLFTVRVMPATGTIGLHIAAVAPQKAFKTAVARNRMKRVIYAAAAPFTISTDKHLIVGIFAKATAIKATSAEVSKDIRDIFVKAGIVR